MKTITIPKRFGYPTIEIISNGNHYTLKSGVEITVEDHLAEIIENAIALAPKYGRNISKIGQLADGSLAELTIDDLQGITCISPYAFYLNKNLKKVTLPESVEVVDSHVFYACNELVSIVFNDGIKSLGENLFTWCSSLKSVYLPVTPPTLANVNAFDSINGGCVFYCKTQESLDAYKKATAWSTLTSTYSFVVEEKKNG